MLAFITSGYFIYVFSILLIYVILATILHLQFGVMGIVNFGIAGFFGLGIYGMGVLIVKFNMPYMVAMILTIGVTGLIAFILGSIILELDNQEILVATLAFATIVGDLVITEKWLTNGVVGLGEVSFPFDFGRYTEFGFLVILIILTALIILYAKKLRKAPYGRLLLSIQDNEVLAQSLGKATTREKLIFFTVTSAAIGFVGTLDATITHFLVPQMLDPGITFTVWIALILGGRRKEFGGLVGALVTIGLFDIIIETYVPIPRQYAQLVPTFKYMAYGLTLILIFMFKPAGLLGSGEWKLLRNIKKGLGSK